MYQVYIIIYDFIYQKRFKIVSTKKTSVIYTKNFFYYVGNLALLYSQKLERITELFLALLSFLTGYVTKLFFLQIKVLEAESNGNTCILSIQYSDHVFSSWRIEQSKMFKYAPIPIPFHVMSQSRFLTALSIQTTKTTLYLLQKIGNDINILSV